MREIRLHGSEGGAPGNRSFLPLSPISSCLLPTASFHGTHRQVGSVAASVSWHGSFSWFPGSAWEPISSGLCPVSIWNSDP